ncbi:MAG: DUF4262 domain-containing protein [Actinomycetota bacterium]|nr:DUF4262 domain-containing protein [Actinomycetota bacterium]
MPGDCAHPSPEVIRHAVRQAITTHGWMTTAVPGDELHPNAEFAYTTGLRTSRAHPELVIAGLPGKTAHELITAAVRQIDAGVRLEHGGEYGGIAEGLRIRTQLVTSQNCIVTFGVTRDWYGDDVPRLQLVWPDRQGRFPGDPENEAHQWQYLAGPMWHIHSAPGTP